MYTRWRLYILAVFLLIFLLCVAGIRFLKARSRHITFFQSLLFVLGVLLCAETIIVSTLSNYNLGVILPAFFGLPMIALAFLLPHMNSGVLCFLKWFAFGCYAAAACIFLVCGILMIRANHESDCKDAEAVIVLGAAVHGDKVTWVLENRLNTAKEFLDSHPSSFCVVSGGMGSGESVTEASAMKKYLMERDIPDDRILVEDRATNTQENFLFSTQLIDACRPGSRIAFVTTDFHVFRAGRVAAKLGIPVSGIPAPDVWYLRVNNFMRECVGICVYALKGQI